MAGLSTITVDLARGEVLLGDRRVRLTSERDDASGAAGRPVLRFRVEDGAVVRLIAFGERSRLVREALADASPSPTLMTLLRAAAHEGPCTTLSDAVLLAMAGGAEAAPQFDRCAVEASRQQAWSWLSVHDTPAIVVDRAVAAPSAAEPPGGWNRYVFPVPETRELEALVQEMVASLLTRGMPVADRRSRAGEAGADMAVTAPVDAPDPVSGREATPSFGRRLSTRAVEQALPASPAADDAIPGGAATMRRGMPRPAGSDRQARASALPPSPPSPSSGHAHGDLSSRVVNPPVVVPPVTAVRGGPGRRRTDAQATVPTRSALSPWRSQVDAPPPGRPPVPAAVTAHPSLSRSAGVRVTAAARAIESAPAVALGTWPLTAAAAPVEAPPAVAAVFPARLDRALPADSAPRQSVPTAGASAVDLMGELAQALAAECDLRGLDA